LAEAFDEEERWKVEGGRVNKPSPWTPEQAVEISNIEQRLAAIANVCQLICGHYARTVESSTQRLNALGKVLVAKRLVTKKEWLAALQEVELGEKAEFSLNEEIQTALEEIRQIVRDAGQEPA
jgi:hypothetical protein